MFTFGRDHEKACAIRHLKDPTQVALIESVIDAVHDLLNAQIEEGSIRPVLSAAFDEGQSGVWQQTGSWLRRLGAEYAQLESLWLEFSEHPHWQCRFRAACFINEMPRAIAIPVGNKLKHDRSEKVRKMALRNAGKITSDFIGVRTGS